MPKVLGHGPLMVQAIANLISNAIKFTKPKTTPQVRIWTEERLRQDVAYIRLWVADNGIGIDANYRERIFQVFERLNSQSQYAGSGVGLAITQKALHRLGGDVGVVSEVGQGSQFWFELPKA